MSWVMPHRQEIDGAAGALIPLCASIGASSLQCDGEEPWARVSARWTTRRLPSLLGRQWLLSIAQWASMALDLAATPNSARSQLHATTSYPKPIRPVRAANHLPPRR